MSLLGKFAIDVQFSDSTTAGGVRSLKTVSLQHASEYDTGRVAVIAGTCGTSAVTVPISPTTYKDATGSAVSFASVSRAAFSADAAGRVKCDGTGDWTLYSRAGQIAVSESFETASFSISTTAGTSAWTLVLYGD
jgi:hypothetical protein